MIRIRLNKNTREKIVWALTEALFLPAVKSTVGKVAYKL
jgi:hypothetical protein